MEKGQAAHIWEALVEYRLKLFKTAIPFPGSDDEHVRLRIDSAGAKALEEAVTAIEALIAVLKVRSGDSLTPLSTCLRNGRAKWQAGEVKGDCLAGLEQAIKRCAILSVEEQVGDSLDAETKEFLTKLRLLGGPDDTALSVRGRSR